MLEINTNIARLEYIIDLCNTITNEIVFESKKTIFETRILDDSMSVMLKLEINITAFASYRTKGFKFFIDTTKIKQLTNILKPKDIAEIQYMQDDNKIKVSSGRLYRKIPLIDISTCNIPDKIPEPNTNIEARVNAEEFSKGIKVAELESDTFTFKKDNNKLYLRALNENTGIELQDFKYINNSGDFSYIYTTEWINRLIKYVPDYLTVKIHSSSKEIKVFPITITFNLKDNIGKATFILAPRVLTE